MRHFNYTLRRKAAPGLMLATLACAACATDAGEGTATNSGNAVTAGTGADVYLEWIDASPENVARRRVALLVVPHDDSGDPEVTLVTEGFDGEAGGDWERSYTLERVRNSAWPLYTLSLSDVDTFEGLLYRGEYPQFDQWPTSVTVEFDGKAVGSASVVDPVRAMTAQLLPASDSNQGRAVMKLSWTGTGVTSLEDPPPEYVHIGVLNQRGYLRFDERILDSAARDIPDPWASSVNAQSRASWAVARTASSGGNCGSASSEIRRVSLREVPQLGIAEAAKHVTYPSVRGEPKPSVAVLNPLSLGSQAEGLTYGCALRVVAMQVSTPRPYSPPASPRLPE